MKWSEGDVRLNIRKKGKKEAKEKTNDSSPQLLLLFVRRGFSV